MADNQLVSTQMMHDIRVSLSNARTFIEEAQAAIQRALDDRPFYVSVANDQMWAGSDGVSIDLGTFDGEYDSSERLSHYVLPLPDTVDDLVANLAELVSASAGDDTAEG